MRMRERRTRRRMRRRIRMDEEEEEKDEEAILWLSEPTHKCYMRGHVRWLQLNHNAQLG